MPRRDPRGEAIHQRALGIPTKNLARRSKIAGIGGHQVATPAGIEGGMIKQTIQPRLVGIQRSTAEREIQPMQAGMNGALQLVHQTIAGRHQQKILGMIIVATPG